MMFANLNPQQDALLPAVSNANFSNSRQLLRLVLDDAAGPDEPPTHSRCAIRFEDTNGSI